MNRCTKCGQYVARVTRNVETDGMFQFSKLVNHPVELTSWQAWFEKKGIEAKIIPVRSKGGVLGYTLWREGIEVVE